MFGRFKAPIAPGIAHLWHKKNNAERPVRQSLWCEAKSDAVIIARSDIYTVHHENHENHLDDAFQIF